jgi:hypothetical protein
MTDLFFPTWLIPSSMNWGYDDFTAADQSATTGATQTSTLFGTRRWHVRMDFGVLKRSDGSLPVFEGLLAQLRGRANRIWLSDVAHQRRGAFPGSELFANNTFSNGTAGWSAFGPAALSVSDRVARMKATAGGAQIGMLQTATLTQYSPHVLRTMLIDGAQSAGLSLGPFLQDATLSFGIASASRGLISASGVPVGTSGNNFAVSVGSLSGFTAGMFLSVPWASLSRCALVDNGQNLLLQSDNFASASWGTKVNCSITSDAEIGPDGTTSVDFLVENGSTGQHFVQQSVTSLSSSVADYAISVIVCANGRSWLLLGATEATGATSLTEYFNLSTGAVGVNGNTGANWANRRSFITPLGGNFYMCTVVGRKTNAATQISPFVGGATADGTSSYAGTNGLAALRLWRGSFAQSSVPVRCMQTTTVAVAAPQTGSALNVKGLPISTTGLGSRGDFVQVIQPTNSQLVRLTDSLDSDAAGLGYMQFEPALKQSPADNAAVIFHQPMGRFMLSSGSVGVELTPGVFGQASLDFVEA